MFPIFLHIYGPIAISSFNIAIALGIIIFIFCTTRDSRLKQLISRSNFINLTTEAAIVAIIGGRLLHVLSDLKSYTNFYEVLSLWNGGLSVLGAILSGLAYAWWFLKKRNIEVLPVLDLIAIYAPIIHAIARIGCFLVGCCHGCPTNSVLSVTYTNPDVFAPLNVALHPAQLYSSFLYLAMFAFLLFIAKRYTFKNGTILVTYLILSGLERIVIDFVRGDRVFLSSNFFNFTINGIPVLSFHQLIAFVLILGATATFCLNRKKA